MKRAIVAVVVCLALPAQADQPKDIVNTYADIAHAMYADALATAVTLDSATKNLTASPSATTLHATRAEWLYAHAKKNSG